MKTIPAQLPTRHSCLTVALWLLVIGLIGCQSPVTQRQAATTLPPSIPVAVVDKPLPIDDPQWARVSRHELVLSAADVAVRAKIAERGQVQFLRDAARIFVRFELEDRDLCTTAKADHDILYMAGDVVELFIGYPPVQVTDTPGATMPPRFAGGSYLELHVAPNAVRSAYIIRRPGLVEKLDPLPFAATVQLRGSLNNHTDADDGWTALIVVDLDTLEKILGANPEGHPLTVLASRYNYGNGIPRLPDGTGEPELTMYPQQPRTAFHLRPFHAPLTSESIDGKTSSARTTP